MQTHIIKLKFEGFLEVGGTIPNLNHHELRYKAMKPWLLCSFTIWASNLLWAASWAINLKQTLRSTKSWFATKVSHLSIGSMYAILTYMHHNFTPNLVTYVIHGSFGIWISDFTIPINKDSINYTPLIRPNQSSLFLTAQNIIRHWRCITRYRIFEQFEHIYGVSKNHGTPKSSILIGFSIINHPFWGTPIFGSTPM